MFRKIIIAVTVIILAGIGYLYYQSNKIPEGGAKKEQACMDSGGSVVIGWCWRSGGNFINTCLIGGCDCPPGFLNHLLYGRKVKFCHCGPGKCFDGEKCVLFNSYLKNKIEIPVFADDKPDTVINSIKQAVNNSFSSVEFLDSVKSSQWWISDDGWSIIVPNAVSIVLSTYTSEVGQMWSAIGSLAKELNDLLSKVLLENGFTFNVTNTSKSEAENEFYDYVVAFQKGETRCILKTDGDNGQYAVVCSDNFQEAYEEQIPYLEALDNRNVIVSVREKIGDFVWLSVHLRRTGYAALMKDDGEKMRLIFTGQEAPYCDLMLKNEVPKEVYGACYDDAGNLVK